jgi:hypothetical protein
MQGHGDSAVRGADRALAKVSRASVGMDIERGLEVGIGVVCRSPEFGTDETSERQARPFSWHTTADEILEEPFRH